MSDPSPRFIAQQSGLTVGQVARLIGVPAREVHDWLMEDTVPARHAARAARVRDFIACLPVDSVVARRRLLLASDRGRSLFHLLLDEVPEQQQLQFPALTVRERLGVV